MQERDIPRLPVDEVNWRSLPGELFVMVCTWTALVAWLYFGFSGAGNIYVTWVWVVAFLVTVAVSVKPKRLQKGWPRPLQLFLRLCKLAEIGVLLWHGEWLAAPAVALHFLMAVAWRQSVDMAIKAQEAPNA